MIDFKSIDSRIKTEVDSNITSVIDSNFSKIYAEYISLNKSYRWSFNLSGVQHFCGGLFLSKLRWMYDKNEKENRASLVEALIWLFQLMRDQHYGIINYVSVEDHDHLNTLLKELNFKIYFEQTNPNSGNDCIHWYLDLTENYDYIK